ncbi:ATP-binding cassette domain-containing protein [Microlunatus sp. GCM10028923]|uniref:ATP-binding cassette domain-containing protein n=1 Tax=Microlunatus sp. GCM10028923 TaxID=3273400 RepID=UPI00360FA217
MSWSWGSLVGRRDANLRDLLTERFRLLALLRQGGSATVAMAATQLLANLGPAAIALAAGLATHGAEAAIGSGDLAPAVPGLVALGAVFLLLQAVQNTTDGLATDVRLRVDGWVRQQARTAAAAQPTLVELGDPQFQEDATRTADLGRRGGRVRSPGGAAVGQAMFTARLIGGVLAAAVLAQFSVLLAIVVPILALLNRAVLRRQWMHLANVDDGQAPIRRRTDYWAGLGQDPRLAGEIRLFGLGPWITLRHRRALVAERGPVLRNRMTVMRQQTLIIGLTVLAASVGILPLAFAAAEGSITAAELVTYLTAVLGVLGVLSAMGHEAFDIEYGRSTVRALDRLLAGAATTSRPRPPARDGALVELHGVRFAYPEQQTPVLDGCDLTIRTGEVLGVVGVNGAGKTTLVKMIAGLLDPTGGEIRVGDDGSVGVTAVFQDLLHYPLSLRDNVALAAPEADGGDEAVLAALAAAGADDLPDRLPAGLDTVLHRDLAGGTDLSGGQWQRVAIARAVYAVHAGRRLVILDEPTANLDVRAETAFYATVVETLPEATVVLISHRLSTVRNADRIVLLADGRIAEQGSHRELVDHGGEYARLFRLQASRFRAEEDRS